MILITRLLHIEKIMMEQLFEPELLPAEFPNLLINGSEGIAVGMATKIPPHCPAEIINACCKFVEDPEISDDDLLNFVNGPDFPTGGIIVGKSEYVMHI